MEKKRSNANIPSTEAHLEGEKVFLLLDWKQLRAKWLKRQLFSFVNRITLSYFLDEPNPGVFSFYNSLQNTIN